MNTSEETNTATALATTCAIDGCTNEAEFVPYLAADKPSYSAPHCEPSDPGQMCRLHCQENERLASGGSRMLGSYITYPYTKPHFEMGYTRYKDMKTGRFLRLVDGRFPGLFRRPKKAKKK